MIQMLRMPVLHIVLAALTFVAVYSGHAHAHGDEDHGAKSTPVAPPAMAKPGASTDSVAARRLPDGSLFVPKAVQRQIGLRHRIAEITTMAATAEFNGKIIADPNAGGRVQADQPGRVEGPLPTLGQRVAKGQVLARLRPTANSIERGNQRSLAAELAAQEAIAEKRLGRLEQLEGAVPQKEIEAARIERDALKQRRAAIGASVGTAEALLAPVSGIIAATHVVAGQVVEAGAILFEVVDPARLAVEALAYDPAQAADIAGATAPLPGGSVLALQFMGAGRQLREQALPLLFRIRTKDAPVAVGQPLKVIASTRRQHTGALLPRAALVRPGTGEAAVWVRDGAERFLSRRVKVESHDAATVAVVAGLKNGDRVVTEGASLLSQVR